MLVDRSVYLLTMAQVYFWIALVEIFFPLFMWRDYLKGKPLGERLMFCVLTQTTYLVNVVQLLGVLKLCNRWTILFSILLEYAVVRWTFSDKQQLRSLRLLFQSCQSVLTGGISIRALWRAGWESRKSCFQAWIRSFWKFLRSYWPQVLVGMVILVYNALFLAHNVTVYHSYQFSDIPVHTAWVYGLEMGTLYVGGVYPFAMHAMIYVVRVLSQISLREIMLYYGSFHTLVMFITLYEFSLKMFRSKWASLFSFVCLSMLLNQGRYGASLPQECGIFAMFSMGYYLISYLEKPRPRHFVRGDSKLRRFFRINQYWSRKYLDLDFFLLVISVAQIISFHFYTAIAAVMLAVVIVGVRCVTFFKKQYFVPVVTAAVAGAVLAVAPFILAVSSGIPFHDSMGWALSVIQGTEWQGTGYGYVIVDDSGESMQLQDMVGAGQEEEETTDLIHSDLPMTEKLKALAEALVGFNEEFMLGKKTTPLLIFSMASAIGFGVLFLFFPSLRRYGQNYLTMAGFVLVMAIMGISAKFGLPSILEPSRSNVFADPVVVLLFAVPLDVLFCLLPTRENTICRRGMAVVSCCLCGLLCFWAVTSGAYHNYFDVNLAYYNEPDYVMRQIQKSFSPFSYTIVSPTDEYYVSVEEGFHTELSEFVAITEGLIPEYTLPTRYVFFFIEKYTLQDYFHGQDFVNRKYAAADFLYQASTQDYYFQRNIIESKAYYWAQDYSALYPNNMSVYFEDDIYIVYVLEQNINSPLSLVLP